MTFSFFIPEEYLPAVSWKQSWEEGKIISLEEGDMAATAQCWIYQTWLLLTETGVDCDLCTQMPEQGCVLTFGEFLKTDSPLSKDIFLIDIVADGTLDPRAQLHLVQNQTHAASLSNALFMPHWSQPHLISRDLKRGNRFENICFFGNAKNLAPPFHLEEWNDRLRRELGMTFDSPPPSRWHDYSNVDCVLAIRDFSHSRQLHKPATKLYNAWQAGVPLIGGRDSAYAADGHSGKNYLEATSLSQVFTHLKQLKKNEKLRSRLVERGFQSASAFTRDATLARWKKLFEETVPMLVKK